MEVMHKATAASGTATHTSITTQTIFVQNKVNPRWNATADGMSDGFSGHDIASKAQSHGKAQAEATMKPMRPMP